MMKDMLIFQRQQGCSVSSKLTVQQLLLSEVFALSHLYNFSFETFNSLVLFKYFSNIFLKSHKLIVGYFSLAYNLI